METENQILKTELFHVKNEYNKLLYSLERFNNEKLKVENETLQSQMKIEKLKTENEKLKAVVDNVKNLVECDSSKKRKADNDHYLPNPFENLRSFDSLHQIQRTSFGKIFQMPDRNINSHFSFGRSFGGSASAAAIPPLAKKETKGTKQVLIKK